MLKSIEMLREIQESCHSGNPLSEIQSNWLGRSLDGFLSHPGTSLRDAFGLQAPQGGIPWWREEAIRARDHALRALAKSYCKDYSISARARYVRKLARRYAASSWRFDCSHNEMPNFYRGTPKEHLWEAFKSGAIMPISERRLRSLLDWSN